MKRIASFLLAISLCTYSATAQLDKLQETRSAANINLEVLKNTITDSSADVLKELVAKQQEVINADRDIIDGYLTSLQKNADSLKTANTNLKSDSEMLAKKFEVYDGIKLEKDILFYILIGGAAFFILFLVFLVLFFIASGKSKKYKKQVGEVEKMREANKKEIELAKKEVETMKTIAKKEIMQAKEDLNKEAKNIQAKVDSLTAEKASLEKKASDKAYEYTQLQLKMNDIKESYEKQLAEAKAGSTDFIKEKLALEKQISDKGLEADNMKRERDAAKQDLADYKDLYEKETRERKTFEAKLTEIENEFRSVAPINAQDFEALKQENTSLRNELNSLSEIRNQFENEKQERQQLENRLAEKENELKNIPKVDTAVAEDLQRENERLHADIDELYKRIDREVAGRNMIEDELRKFIDELKNLR